MTPQLYSNWGTATLEEVEEEVKGKIYDTQLMRRLLRYMWPYRKHVGFALVFLSINSVLQIAGPLLVKIAIDRYLAPSPNPAATVLDP